MGSKRLMLENGLGKFINKQIPNFSSFFDLMCGAGAVSCFVAENHVVPVNAFDLQKYAVILTNAIIKRSEPINFDPEFSIIIERVKKKAESDKTLKLWKKICENLSPGTKEYVDKARVFSEKEDSPNPILNSYGGHYFSPTQARFLDILLEQIPELEKHRTEYLAAIISAASEAAASPGHTAQPFQPTKSSIKYIFESWEKNICSLVESNLRNICSRFAKQRGLAEKANALDIIQKIPEDALVFIDPPYSNVQYSRFYHVLETIARQKKESVFGKGRYPPIEKRPQSSFSKTSEAKSAFTTLLEKLSKRDCSVIITFPQEECSNGLSGEFIQEIASAYFKILESNIPSKLSSLGGNNEIRDARIKRNELILFLSPK